MNLKLLAKHFSQIIRGNWPTSKIDLSKEEAKEVWTRKDKDHLKTKPRSGSFSDYLYGCSEYNYKNIFTKKERKIRYFGRIPHCYILGAEGYGKLEIVFQEEIP